MVSYVQAIVINCVGISALFLSSEKFQHQTMAWYSEMCGDVGVNALCRVFVALF